MKRPIVVALAVTAAALASACGGGQSRAGVLEPVLSEQVPARFDEFADTTAEARDGVAAWCAGLSNRSGGGPAPDAEIAAALTEWYALKPFWSGPVMERRSQFAVYYPADPDGIAELLESNDPVDASYLLERVAADKRGLGALSVLLTDDPSPRRCDYALGIADLVADEASALARDWAEFGPSAIGGDATANDATRDIVSNATFALRESEMDPPPPPAIEQGLLDGVRVAMLGTAPDQPGLSPLLDEDLVARLTDELDRDDAAAAALTLSVDVASDLGITLNFSDADGDG